MSPGELEDADPQSASKVKHTVAQTLHETVMQTLVATTYLAESPKTTRKALVECLRQATYELRAVIDDLTEPEVS